MIRDGEDLEEIIRIAEALARAQEAEINRMQEVGLDVKHAEALLSAYREALRLATEHHRTSKERHAACPSKMTGNASKR
jgi:hypothetical protein